MKRFLLLCLLLGAAPLLAACGNLGLTGGEAQTIRFQDTFTPGQTGNWLLEGDEFSRANILDDRLLIEVDGTNLVHYATLTGQEFGDYTLTVDITQLAGDNSASHDILFRMDETGAFYRLAVSPLGRFRVELHDGLGGSTMLTNGWQETTSLRGVGESNQIKITALGSNLFFYANDLLLAEIQDSSLSTGRIALGAGTFGRGGLVVSFDNLVVR